MSDDDLEARQSKLDRAALLLNDAIELVKDAADEPHRGGIVVNLEAIQQRIEKAQAKLHGKARPHRR